MLKYLSKGKGLVVGGLAAVGLVDLSDKVKGMGDSANWIMPALIGLVLLILIRR